MQEGVSEVQVSGVLWHGYACYTRCMMMRSLRDARRACSCWASRKPAMPLVSQPVMMPLSCRKQQADHTITSARDKPEQTASGRAPSAAPAAEASAAHCGVSSAVALTCEEACTRQRSWRMHAGRLASDSTCEIAFARLRYHLSRQILSVPRSLARTVNSRPLTSMMVSLST